MSAAEQIAPLKTFDHRRVVLADLQSRKGEWLLSRLREKYPNKTDAEIVSWLRGCTSSSEYFFVQTDRAMALAMIYREDTFARTSVRECFVLCTAESAYEQGAYLYSVIREWAAQLGAYELVCEVFTDVPRERIKERVGGLFKRDQVFAKLG